jgi:hypothetical protein
VPREFAIRDRFLLESARPGRIVGARLVRRRGLYRLLVTVSWMRGEFTVTGYSD